MEKELDTESKLILRSALRDLKNNGWEYRDDEVFVTVTKFYKFDDKGRRVVRITFYNMDRPIPLYWDDTLIDENGLPFIFVALLKRSDTNFDVLSEGRNYSLKYDFGLFNTKFMLPDHLKNELGGKILEFFSHKVELSDCHVKDISMAWCCRNYFFGKKVLTIEYNPLPLVRHLVRIPFDQAMENSELGLLKNDNKYYLKDFGLFVNEKTVYTAVPYTTVNPYASPSINRYYFNKVSGNLECLPNVNDNPFKVHWESDWARLNPTLLWAETASCYIPNSEKEVEKMKKTSEKELKKGFEKVCWSSITNSIKAPFNEDKTIFDMIDKIYLAEPKTIVLFKDGGKEIVTCYWEDDYDPMAGILICVMKHLYTGSQTKFSKEFGKLEGKIVNQKHKDSDQVSEIQKILDAFNAALKNDKK